LKFTNTVSPPPSPKFHILEGTAKKIFGVNAPTSSPQTSDQVSANACLWNRIKLCRHDY